MGLGLGLGQSGGRTRLNFTGRKIVQVGTSITDNGYQLPSESASVVGYTGRGIDAWARVLTNQNIDWVNKGESGDAIDDIVARYAADVTAENPYAVIVEAGTNDSGQTQETIQGDLQTLYNTVTSSGHKLIPLTVPMRAAAVWNDTIRDKMLAVNTWIKSNFANAIEVNEFFVDGDNRPLTNYTDDGTHPSNIGAHALARPLVTFLNARTGNRNIVSSGTAVNSNPTLTGTSGSKDVGITGTVPTGYHWDIVSHSGTAVVTANDPGMEIVFTPGSSASTEDYQFRTNPLNVAVTASTAYELLADMSFSAWSGWAYVQLELEEVGQGRKYDLYQIMDDTTYLYPTSAISGIWRTAALTSVGTNLRLRIEVGIDPNASGTGTLTVNSFKLREVV